MPEDQMLLLPDLGEGLVEAKIVQILAAAGTEVRRLDPVFEVETDKSVVEVTSPWTGTVLEVLVAEEEWVDVGAPLARISAAGGA